MEAVLDPTKDFDIVLFDNVVKAFYTGPRYEILEKLVRTRWRSIPSDQRIGIRHFVVGMIMKVTTDEARMRKEKAFLNKLNLTLIQILKHEWPHDWSTFIPDLVQFSKTSLTRCENNMAILKLLSEEIFDFSAEQMVQAKIDELKNSMCGEFSQIFQLCLEVLEKAQKISLIRTTLETLLRFLNWIPLNYIFESALLDMLLTRLLETSDFRNPTLKCLSEIAAFNIAPEFDPKFVILFAMVMNTVNRMIPPDTNIAEAYEFSKDDDQEFIFNLALFLTNFCTNHLRIIETARSRDMLLNAHLYLIKISLVKEREILKICLEYWIYLVAELYDEMQNVPVGEEALFKSLSIGSKSVMLEGVSLRRDLYIDVLSNLRLVVIERMVKPEEVLIAENEDGEIVREFMKESETVVLSKLLRETLVYLTHLDIVDTEDILTEKLLKQVDGSEWSWNNLNTLCWAIGSISGTMNEETEKRFLVVVIKDLLGLCEIKQGKDNKAIVASNIMYIVGQYPQFLKAHWKFLKTVINKLFEFMHESHEGVQDMACDTFIKIAQKCKRQFIIQQAEESEPFIEHILKSLHEITVDLSPQQVHTVYEAIGHMVSAQSNKPIQEKLIVSLMELPNSAWDALIAQAGNVDILGNIENLKVIINILKTNVAACNSIGAPYLSQLGCIYLDMLGLYRACSGILNQVILQEGSLKSQTPKCRYLQIIRKEILKLMDVYVKKADDLDAVNDNLIPPLLEAILGDYANNPGVREAEVLNLLVTLITSLKQDRFTLQIPTIMDSVFETTLNMIDKDFIEFPECRSGFYKLLRAINLYCFDALLSMEPGQLKLYVDSTIWGIKHTLRDISDLALTSKILQDTLWVITDADHKSGEDLMFNIAVWEILNLQTQLLAKILELVQTGHVVIPLFDPSTISDPDITNFEFLKDYCFNLLHNAFPLLQSDQIRAFLGTLFQSYSDLPRFKLALRDFLVQLKEFSGDNADLYLEEKERETQQRAQEKQNVAMRIPGMLKPSQLEVKADDDIS
ncbi:hypothetical protein Clacol_006439 [Clathrus columnatus]|uniref:Exportin-1 n=1 Tax=Clathrus columnatus TaxID=1419009 RepID=A0AAV5AFB4_9AGAM|nr:hypothetical protein Clacol_006439 [Clathrus columnatus]